MANQQDIKRRIKSVESTMQITKAMELVASSKLRKAKERADAVRPYFNVLFETMYDVASHNKNLESPYTRVRPVKRSAYLVIAGDRGLAGGYNSNLLRFAESMMQGENPLIIPLGKRVSEYFAYRSYEMQEIPYEAVEGLYQDEAYMLADILGKLYCQGVFDELYIIYTEFVSMLSQEPTSRKILPISFADVDFSGREEGSLVSSYTTFEPSASDVFDRIVPMYVGGLVFGAISESYASEQAARRVAMEAASDNAQKVIDTLSLHYNRARQGAITQEITEIVAGANALS